MIFLRSEAHHWISEDKVYHLGTLYSDRYWALTVGGDQNQVFCYAKKIHPCPDTQSGWRCYSNDEWKADVKFRLECIDEDTTTTMSSVQSTSTSTTTTTTTTYDEGSCPWLFLRYTWRRLLRFKRESRLVWSGYNSDALIVTEFSSGFWGLVNRYDKSDVRCYTKRDLAFPKYPTSTNTWYCRNDDGQWDTQPNALVTCEENKKGKNSKAILDERLIHLISYQPIA